MRDIFQEVLKCLTLISVPENVWKIDELVLDESKEVDFGRVGQNNWWNSEPLKSLDLSSNAISSISQEIKFLQCLVTLKVYKMLNILLNFPFML